MLVRGRCPEELTEVLLSDRAVARLELGEGTEGSGGGEGTVVEVEELGQERPIPNTSAPFPTRLEVVGVYRPRSADPALWPEPDLFGDRAAEVRAGATLPQRLDAVIASRALLQRLDVLPVSVASRRSLDTAAVDVEVAERVEQAVTSELAAGERRSGQVVRDAPVAQVLAEVAAERRSVALAALLVTCQVVLLSWYVLFILVAETAAARSGEVALGKLRGLRPVPAALLALAEPASLLLLAFPLGLAAALAAAVGLARVALLEGTPVAMTAYALGAAALAVLGALAATVLAVRATLSQPVLEQLQRVPPARSTRLAVLVEGVVVAAAAVSLYQIGTSAVVSGTDVADLTLVVPALASLAAGLLGVRLLVPAARLWVRHSRRSARLPGFLASRQLTRRAAGGGTGGVIVLVAVAVGLSTFSVDAWAVAREHRGLRAATDVGAASVVAVEPVRPTQLRAAVRAADPEGSAAMAVVAPSGAEPRGPDRLLAVDVDRLVGVATWRAEWAGLPLQEVVARLRPQVTPELSVRGSAWELDLVHLQRENPLDIVVLAELLLPDGSADAVRFAPVPQGPSTVAAEAPQCQEGCRVTGYAVRRVPGQVGPLLGALTLAELRVDGAVVAAGFATEGAWRPTRFEETPNSELTGRLAPSSAGLEVVFALGSRRSPGVRRTDVPEVLPALVAGVDLQPLGTDDQLSGFGLDGGSTVLRSVTPVTVLPRLGRDGVLVDLAAAERTASYNIDRWSSEVWLAADAPAAIETRLAVAGLEVLDRTYVAGRRSEIDREGTALGLDLMLAGAGAAVLLALAGVVATWWSAARRRAYEVAALRALGVSSSSLRRAGVVENAVLLGCGVVIGAATGLACAELVLPVLPLTGDTGSGPPRS